MALTPQGENHLFDINCFVDATGVEPVQSYLCAGGLQPLELADAQHVHKAIEPNRSKDDSIA